MQDLSYEIGFDLSYNSVLEHYLPTAFIVEKENDILKYIKNSTHKDTLKNLDVPCSETEKKLIELTQELALEALVKKYCKNKKTKAEFEKLLANAASKKVIYQHLSYKLNLFLKTIAQNNCNLSLELDAENWFQAHQIKTALTPPIVPKLYFDKNPDYIDYTLQLSTANNEYYPSDYKTIIVLNEPAWIIFDQKLFVLEKINGNKLKPFITKKNIQIPNKNSVEYFEKFIKKIIQQTPIEAQGFSIETHNVIKSHYLTNTQSVFQKKQVFELFFEYENYTFGSTTKKEKHISLAYHKNEEFYVYETTRNFESEQNIINQLQVFGLHFDAFGFASFNELNSDDIYENISVLMPKTNDFIKSNTKLKMELFNKKVCLITPKLESNISEKQDWFDVDINVVLDKTKIAFITIIPLLKKNERLFYLEDDSVFIIPFEWFSDYKSLIEFGTIANHKISIQKSQYKLLENNNLASEKIFKTNIISYNNTNSLNAIVRNYQKEGINWLLKNYQLGLGSCLADDMGLGKTLQTLAFLDFIYQNFEDDFMDTSTQNSSLDLFSINEDVDAKKTLKAIIVCPSSLVFNWINEIKKFVPYFSVLNYTGSKREHFSHKIREVDIVIISYGTLLKDIKMFNAIAFNLIILDESQQIKNRKSKINKALLGMNCNHKISLSGTPIENSLSDLWSQMEFINPNILGTYSFFDSFFKNPIEKLKDEDKIEELKSIINPYVLRRTKKEVLTDLPPVIEQVFYTQMDEKQASIYEKEKSSVRNYLLVSKTDKTISKISILNAISKLRQLANHPLLLGLDAESGKFNDVTNYLSTLYKSNQKVLIFSSYVSHLEIYSNWCVKQNIKFVTLTGKTSATDREKQVALFQEDSTVSFFFISLKAGGVGLNLTKASYVLLLDPWWNPFAEEQAIGRAHRIGQENQVNIVKFIAKNTIEEKIVALQVSKKEISNAVIEGVEKSLLDENLEFLLH